MYIWIVQPFESTPLDSKSDERLWRSGILANTLIKNGHKVLWWTSDFDHKNRIHRHKSNKRIALSDKFSIQYIKSLGYKKNVSIKRILDHILLAKRFKSLIKKEKLKPDIILASIPLAELALESSIYAKKFNIPIVVDIRDLWPDAFFDVLPKYFKNISFLINIILNRTLKNACKSATAINGITEPYVKWGLAKAERERTSIDRSFLHGYISPKLKKKEKEEGLKFWANFNIHDDTKYLNVCYLGVLGHVYNFSPIIEAARIANTDKLPIKFIICGKGPKLKDLKTCSKEIDNLIVPGWIYKNQIKSLLAISDVGIAPYQNIFSFINTISNKAAEYLSASLPIALGINEGILFEKLRKYNAGFSYSENPRILLRELLKIKNDLIYFKQIQANALSLYQKELDANKIYSQYSEYLESLIQ